MIAAQPNAKPVQESLDVLEILACYDPHSFKTMVQGTTSLKVIPMQQRDPLIKTAMDEEVQAIAAIFNEDRKLTVYESKVKQLGYDYDYLVV